MLKRNIATVVIAGLFAGTVQAAHAQYPTAGAEGGEAWGKITYTFNPGAERVVQAAHAGYPTAGAEGGEAWGKVEYLFKQNAGAAAQQQIASASSTFPSAWTQWID